MTLAERYFRKDEKALFVEVMPWYYFLSPPFFLLLLLYSMIVAPAFLLWNDMPIAIACVFCLPGVLILYYSVTRSLYPNYAVISQTTVYRFIQKSIKQFDELPLSNVRQINVRPIPLSKSRCSITFLCTNEYIRSRPEHRRQYEIRHAQQNPEKVNPRFLASRKPIRLRLVAKKPKEYISVFSELRQVMGYCYTLSVKGIQ